MLRLSRSLSIASLIATSCIYTAPATLGPPIPPKAQSASARPTGAKPASRQNRPSAPEVRRAWGGDDQSPRLEYARRFSPSYYERFAERSLYLEGLATQIANATIQTRLHAIEIDFFEDDDYYREGELVMLGAAGGVVTAFASRCYVDITYPTTKLYQDGFGGTEWGVSKLTLGKGAQQSTAALKLMAVEERPDSVAPGTVRYRRFADNDAVLLYFNPRDLAAVAPGRLQTMQLDEPDAEVERIVAEATSIFGQEYVLISKTCFKALKDAVPEEDLMTDLLLSVSGRFFTSAISRFVLKPLFKTGTDKLGEFLGEQAAKVFTRVARDVVDGLESRAVRVERKTMSVRTLQGFRAKTRAMGVRAVALPETRMLGPARANMSANTLPLVPRSGTRIPVFVIGSMSTAAPDPLGAQLIGVALPPPGTEERVALDDYLAQLMRRRPAQFIRFTPARPGRSGPPRGLVLVPDEQVVLNYEIIRQGLARFDASDPAVAVTFPELARAASQALDAGTGFAGRWRHDEAYRRSLQAPNPMRHVGVPAQRIQPRRPSRPLAR